MQSSFDEHQLVSAIEKLIAIFVASIADTKRYGHLQSSALKSVPEGHTFHKRYSMSVVQRPDKSLAESVVAHISHCTYDLGTIFSESTYMYMQESKNKR